MRAAILLSLLAACASPTAAAKRDIEATKERSPHLDALSEAEVKKAIPKMFDRMGVPNLVRTGALMPKTMQAEMMAWGTLQREGTIDRRLLGEVFYVVSHANDCFY
jgi:hypothetical protein